MKQQINFRASELTGQQLAQLTQQTGMLQTEVISVAIDRMFREETKMKTSKYEQAKSRIDEMDFTNEQQEFIFADWPEREAHYEWLLTASKKEIVSWGEASNWGITE